MPNIKISQRMMTRIFWDEVLGSDDERSGERQKLLDRLNVLEELRTKADYNTGSISFAAAWCLYSIIRYFAPKRVIEIGTFIGKSAVSILAAMDDRGIAGEIFTCDNSNSIVIPWQGTSRINQFPKCASTDMLKQLSGTFDFVFLDGRLQQADLPLLDKLITPSTIVCMDDFEGIEKGVANVMVLGSLPKLRNHFLIYPASESLLRHRGFVSHSLIAIFLPTHLIELARQG